MSISRPNNKDHQKYRDPGCKVNQDTLSLEELIKNSAEGDFEAFGELYTIYMTNIYRFVFYQVHDKMTAEDLTEEIFIKAWKAIGSYKGNCKAFLSWLYRIAHNYVVDYFHLARRKASLDSGVIAGSADPIETVERNMMRENVSKMLSVLPARQKQVIILKFIEGFDNQEIEEITGHIQGSIRIMQMRALAKIRKSISKEEGQWALNYQIS